MDERKDNKIIPKIVCVVLAFALWLYVTNVENPTRTSTINNVSVTVRNKDVLADSDLVLSPNQTFTVNVKVEGPANDVYSLDKNDFDIEVDLKNYALKEGTNTIPVTVVSYPSSVKIKNKDVLSLNVQIEKLETREFNITNKVNNVYSKGYSLAYMKVVPSSVKVSGPESLINQISEVAIEGDIKDVSRSYSKDFEIVAYDEIGNKIEGLTFSDNTATLKVSVNKSKEVQIKTSYSNALQDGITLTQETLSKNLVYIYGNENLISNIDYVELEPINLANITSSQDISCKIILPEGVTCEDDSIVVSLSISDNRTVTKTFDGVEIDYTDKISEFDYETTSTGVSITVSGKQEDIDSITASDIKVTASCSDLQSVGDNQSVTWNATIDKSSVSIVNSSGQVTINVKNK